MNRKSKKQVIEPKAVEPKDLSRVAAGAKERFVRTKPHVAIRGD